MKTDNFFSGIGEFETGCHTEHGNELALFAQTTRHLYDDRQEVFAATLTRKTQWNKAFPFDAEAALRPDSKRMFNETVKAYRSEIGENFSVNATTLQDFTLWICREFEQFEIENKIRKTA